MGGGGKTQLEYQYTSLFPLDTTIPQNCQTCDITKDLIFSSSFNSCPFTEDLKFWKNQILFGQVVTIHIIELI